MDKGPFRVQTRESGRPPTRAEEQPRQERIVEDMPRTGYSRQQVADQPSKSGKRFIMPAIIALLIVVLAGVVGWAILSPSKNDTSSMIDSSKYQAVFFTNGQVYFGKLQAAGSDTMKLTDVFYLQTESQNAENKQNPQSTSSDQASSNVQLIKLGDEIHGPEDEMAINKDQVLFYENIKEDSKVAESIGKYKDTH